MTQTHGATAVPEHGGPGPSADKPGLPARLALFYRQVVAELRKVIWPTRAQLITYTSVVIVFVLLVIAYVSALDFGFSQLTLWIFG